MRAGLAFLLLAMVLGVIVQGPQPAFAQRRSSSQPGPTGGPAGPDDNGGVVPQGRSSDDNGGLPSRGAGFFKKRFFVNQFWKCYSDGQPGCRFFPCASCVCAWNDGRAPPLVWPHSCEVYIGVLTPVVYKK